MNIEILKSPLPQGEGIYDGFKFSMSILGNYYLFAGKNVSMKSKAIPIVRAESATLKAGQ